MLDPAAIMKVLTDARDAEAAAMRAAAAARISDVREHFHRHAASVLNAVIAKMAHEIGLPAPELDRESGR